MSRLARAALTTARKISLQLRYPCLSGWLVLVPHVFLSFLRTSPCLSQITIQMKRRQTNRAYREQTVIKKPAVLFQFWGKRGLRKRKAEHPMESRKKPSCPQNGANLEEAAPHRASFRIRQRSISTITIPSNRIAVRKSSGRDSGFVSPMLLLQS
jgi:hypothetical protein